MRPFLAFCLFACATASFAQQNNNSFANGDFQSGTASFQFDARGRVGNDGPGGDLSYSDATMTLAVTFDCVVVSGSRAAMSGTITSSSAPELVGQQALLAVEDNGNGNKASPDRFAWFPSSPLDCNAFTLATAALQNVDGGRIHVKQLGVTF